MDKTLPQTLRLLDAIEAAAPGTALSPLPEGWEGRPDQWCAHLDRLCQAQGLAVHPDVIARVVLDAAPTASRAQAVPKSNSGCLHPVHGLDPSFVEHPTLSGWEMPSPARLWERAASGATSAETFTFFAKEFWVPVFFLTLFLGAALAFVGYGAPAVGSFAGLLLVLSAVQRWWLAPSERKFIEASSEQVEAWRRRRALWNHVPGVSACLAEIDASDLPLNAQDAYRLDRLLVAEEQRQSRNLSRLRKAQAGFQKADPSCSRLGAIVEEW